MQTIDAALDKVLAARGVYFDWKLENGGGHDIGFIAEEVGAVVPELVAWEEDGFNAAAMKYDRVTALLVEGVRELKAQNDHLRARLEALERAVGVVPAP